jgi:hypothetical protein
VPNKSWEVTRRVYNVFVLSSPSGDTVEGDPTRADETDERAAAGPGKGNLARPICRTINASADKKRMSQV